MHLQLIIYHLNTMTFSIQNSSISNQHAIKITQELDGQVTSAIKLYQMKVLMYGKDKIKNKLI